MKKFLMILIAALLLGAAAAAEFPSEGDVVLSANGEVVGFGEFQDGNLELRLLAGFNGFANITVVDEGGNEFNAEVMVTSDSEVVLGGTEDLEEVIEADGGEVTVTVHDTLEVSGNMAFGAAVPDHVELPQVALDGMARAEENHEAAQERAEENRANAGASAEGHARGEASAGEDAEVAAGADASVGVGLGLGSDE